MIAEVARLTVRPEQSEAFEAAVHDCVDLFRTSQGCRHMRLEQIVEVPGGYHLVVGWETVDDHMVNFRASASYLRWRHAVGHFFTTVPEVIHTYTVATWF